MSRIKKSQVSEQAKVDDLRSFILEHWQVFGGLPEQYQWPWERARWHEMVFCLMLRLGQPELDADKARRLTSILVDLNILDVETLAGLALESTEKDFASPDLVLMRDLLERSGLDSAKTRKTVITICQAALGLQEHHQSKVQRYLRHYGQQILDDLDTHFSFTKMSREDARYAFTHWLQNVLNMPLALSDPAVERLCKELGVSVEELVAVSDDLDLNLALLDDMVATSVDV